MNIRKILAGTIISMVFFLPAFGFCSGLEGPFEVLGVTDRGALNILYHGKKETVRFLCIDTMDRQALAYTRSRLVGRRVHLRFEGPGRGRYNAFWAYVFLGTLNYNLELIEQGWCPYYTGYGDSKYSDLQLRTAEKMARINGWNYWQRIQKNINTYRMQKGRGA